MILVGTNHLCRLLSYWRNVGLNNERVDFEGWVGFGGCGGENNQHWSP